ncbi:cytochrome d ubiquinol oxidase subunit II [Prauserella muralis]|uniref:Cytochrome d ubiquinol oxidase subunit II n=1 Tax=Prauserella muralis TaxID=588067 RepID=A0A2V4AQM9_9PSEU|nr:cytochrome d ubiquinol oxidase subunit II [Prauserella muralis]PXY22334.1 cytochrome d ubiquinol oxidase subunit II [Prauserella muralis]TWE27986.1 cytochrome bd-I ubiquinol oxidase subunit 2 apoprotein [Prauserella muralis]
MALTDIWFILIAVLWTGYFVLEGFDFGVGSLLPVLGRDDTDRRVMINTIGPVWDGNEVWLLVAGGATFAAFPLWYASLFSGFYLALLVILVALILRGVAFEFRGKIDSARWRRGWDYAIIGGSAVPALLWGVAFGNIVRGVPLDADHNFTGSFFDLLNPYALLGGLTTLSVFTLHGAIFLALKTEGEIRERARALVLPLGLAAILAAGGFLIWTQADFGKAWTLAPVAVAALGLVGSLVATREGRDGWAFTGTAVAIVSTTVALFGSLYPNVLPSITAAAGTLTTTNAASTPYTLTIMTWVAVAFTPIVLIYQAWSYWVFRKRIGRAAIPASAGLPARQP